jgi:hypothetical protein
MSLSTSFPPDKDAATRIGLAALDAAEESSKMPVQCPQPLLRVADFALPPYPYTFTGSKGANRVHLSPV